MPGDNDRSSTSLRMTIGAIILIALAIAGTWRLTRPAEAPVPESLPPQSEAIPPDPAPSPVEIIAAPKSIENPLPEPPAALPIDDANAIKGIVVDTAGEPIPDAKVSARRESGWQSFPVDVDGRFAIPNLEWDPYYVTAEAKYYNRGGIEQVYPGGSEITIVLTSRSSISVTVLDEANGNYLSMFDASVLTGHLDSHEHSRAIQYSPKTKWKTAVNGSVVFDDVSSREDAAVAARADGYAAHFIKVDPALLLPGKVVDVTVRLQREWPIEGIVLAPNRTPVAKASIYLDKITDNEVAVSDAEGRFRILGLPPKKHILVASHPNYLPGSAESVYLDRPYILEIQFNIAGSLEGTLTQGGTPIPNRSIKLSRSEQPAFDQSISTDDFGRYQFNDLPPGSATLSTPENDQNGFPIKKPVLVQAGSVTRANLELPITNSGIHGAITLHSEPVSNAQVQLAIMYEGLGFFYSVTSDSNGFYEFDAISAGAATITVISGGSFSQIMFKFFSTEIPPDKTIIFDIELGGNAALFGNVANINPVDEMVLVIFHGRIDLTTLPDGPAEQIIELGVADFGFVDEDGSYVIENLSAGTYTIAVFAGDTLSKKLSDLSIVQRYIELSEGQELKVDFSL